MKRYLHPHSPWRIFAFSAFVTIASVIGVLVGMGPGATLIALVLVAVEVAFSFDNAIVNTKVLKKCRAFGR